jgi:hypothetical protein
MKHGELRHCVQRGGYPRRPAAPVSRAKRPKRFCTFGPQKQLRCTHAGGSAADASCHWREGPRLRPGLRAPAARRMPHRRRRQQLPADVTCHVTPGFPGRCSRRGAHARTQRQRQRRRRRRRGRAGGGAAAALAGTAGEGAPGEEARDAEVRLCAPARGQTGMRVEHKLSVRERPSVHGASSCSFCRGYEPRPLEIAEVRSALRCPQARPAAARIANTSRSALAPPRCAAACTLSPGAPASPPVAFVPLNACTVVVTWMKHRSHTPEQLPAHTHACARIKANTQTTHARTHTTHTCAHTHTHTHTPSPLQHTAPTPPPPKVCAPGGAHQRAGAGHEGAVRRRARRHHRAAAGAPGRWCAATGRPANQGSALALGGVLLRQGRAGRDRVIQKGCYAHGDGN